MCKFNLIFLTRGSQQRGFLENAISNNSKFSELNSLEPSLTVLGRTVPGRIGPGRIGLGRIELGRIGPGRSVQGRIGPGKIVPGHELGAGRCGIERKTQRKNTNKQVPGFQVLIEQAPFIPTSTLVKILGGLKKLC